MARKTRLLFEGEAPVSASRNESDMDRAKITASEGADGKPVVIIAWKGTRFARPMLSGEDAEKLAAGLTTVRLNQSIAYRLGFRREEQEQPRERAVRRDDRTSRR